MEDRGKKGREVKEGREHVEEVMMMVVVVVVVVVEGR